MMNSRNANSLILIENGHIFTYELDNKLSWEIGRPAKDNIPDIKLHSITVSRKHGQLFNMDGVWFYLDYNGRNGTIFNHKRLEPGLKGSIKPVLLNDGDTFVFGGGENEVVNCKTIWAMFVTKLYSGEWKIRNSNGYKRLTFLSNDETVTIESPKKGFVFRRESGIAIYMDDLTYLIGDVEIVGQ